MADIAIRPLRSWDGAFTIDRKGSPFHSTQTATMTKLHAELDHVEAAAVVIQLAVDVNELRLDGGLRSAARPEHPGVVLTFTSPRLGKVRFSTDRFLAWEDNLRAIALGMEALRRVDRYGITSDGQQYAGFRAIEAAESARAFETVEQAAQFVVRIALDGDPEEKVERIAEAILEDDELVDVYYRRAAKNAHPDVAGGSEATMARLTVARAMLEEHAA